MRKYQHVRIHIYIYAMTQCDPSNMLENTKLKRPKTCYTFHSCLGFGKSLEQYRASEALVSWFRAALYCSSDSQQPDTSEKCNIV